MQNQLNDILYDTAEEVFENLAFVLTMPEGEGMDDFDIGNFEPATLGEKVTESENNFASEKITDMESTDDVSEISKDETIVASIHFRGPFEGDIFLEASTALLPIVGMNMLGLDDENALTHEEQIDAFRELLNVICGNLLPAIVGVKAVFNIDSAELHTDTTMPETFNGKSPLSSAHFGLEVGHAKLALFADKQIYQTKEANAQSCV